MGDEAKHGPTIVALLAVLVTGAVGYAGVVSTREAAQSSERSAEVTEIRAARSAREQADVLELRTVLDKAALDLGHLMGAVQFEQETWNNYLLAVHYYHRPSAARRIEREYRPLHWRSTTASENWGSDLTRLEVRLGSERPLTLLYRDAGGMLAAVSHEMATCLHGGCFGDYERSSFDTVEKAGQYQAKFREAAVTFVNSQT